MRINTRWSKSYAMNGKKRPFFFFFLFIFLGQIHYLPTVTSKKTDLKEEANPPRNKKNSQIQWYIIPSIALLVGYQVAQKLVLRTDRVVKDFHLYKIEGKKGQPIYLYGVSHIKDDSFSLPPIMEVVAKKTTLLATELDFDHDLTFILYRNTLVTHLLQKASEHNKEFTWIAPFLNHLKNYQQLKKTKFIYNGFIWLAVKKKGKVQYTEEILYQLFKNKKKIGLETLEIELKSLGEEFHITHLNPLNPKKIGQEEADLLWQQLLEYENNEAFRKEMDIAAETYQQEKKNPNSILTHDMPQLMAVPSRNRSWLSIIMKKRKKHSLLMAVGALHLPYEEGLLALFLKKGLQVTRIDSDGNETNATEENYNEPFI